MRRALVEDDYGKIKEAILALLDQNDMVLVNLH